MIVRSTTHGYVENVPCTTAEAMLEAVKPLIDEINDGGSAQATFIMERQGDSDDYLVSIHLNREET